MSGTNKTRLVVVTHFYPAHGGGVEKVAAVLASHVAARLNCAVVWAASDCDAPPQAEAALRPLPMRAWNGIERHLGFPWPIWSPAALHKLWQEISLADAVHLHDALYFGNVCAALFARWRGIPIVVTQHVGDVPFSSGPGCCRAQHESCSLVPQYATSLGRFVGSGIRRSIAQTAWTPASSAPTAR